MGAAEMDMQTSFTKISLMQRLMQTILRAPRKIGLAATIGQGRRRLGHESQSALPGEAGIFRGALKSLRKNRLNSHVFPPLS
jgi:hypothetical protein